MGVIQGSINNLLTTAGVAARLSPGAEEKIAERKGRAEAIAKKAEIGAETEASRQAVDISRQAFEETTGAKTYAELTGRKKALGAHIANLEKYRTYAPSEEIESELQSLYKEYEPLEKQWSERRAEFSERGHKAVQTRRAKKAEAERQAAEALQLEQERAKQSEQFRQMFTEGGRYK